MTSKEWLKAKVELLQKGWLYFQKEEAYFKPSVSDEVLEKYREKCWDYPIDFYSLLSGIHFRNFDDQGVPVQWIGGSWVYSNSMILAFGIANIQGFIRTGQEVFLEKAIIQGEYILRTAVKINDGFVLKGYDPQSKAHIGASSAMDQGQAACLFIRLFQLLDEEKWIVAARKMFPSYEISYKQGGVASLLSKNEIWLEEYPFEPLKHTLNGALFGVLGICEYAKLTGELLNLKLKVVNGTLAMMPKFDRGFWSNYHVTADGSKKPYIASMKYHILHIVELRILANLENNMALLEFSERFHRYQTKKMYRLWAMLTMIRSKLFKEYR